jgi:hypothetical protein
MAANPNPVSRSDIERKLREIRGGVEQGAEAAAVPLIAAGAAAVLGLVVVAYMLGRRKGKKSRTVIEVKRG